jgi:hypothetical protein
MRKIKPLNKFVEFKNGLLKKKNKGKGSEEK